jgi:hypothetical protein
MKVLLRVAMKGCVGDVTRNAIFLPFGSAFALAGMKNNNPSVAIKPTTALTMSISSQAADTQVVGRGDAEAQPPHCASKLKPFHHAFVAA